MFIKGLCSFTSGLVGCGHATSTYGGNIGAVGVSKVNGPTLFWANPPPSPFASMQFLVHMHD